MRRRRLTSAHITLRAEQAHWAGAMPGTPGASSLDVALHLARERATAMPRDGEFVRSGVFKYPIETERLRWKRTEEILERIDPGPHEDANYIAMLAREAAAIEVTLEEGAQNGATGPLLLSRVLLGTTGQPLSRGSSSLVDDMAVIMISAGMVDLMYQTSKAVVLSWKQIPAPPGSSVSFSSLAEDTEAVLDADSTPVDLLFDTLATWLYEGGTRASTSVNPPPEYHPPLKLLINGSERFVLAHEYGHAFMDQLAPMPGDTAGAWDRELRADAFGLRITAESSAMLDRVPPNMALQGAVLAMRAHALLEAALQVASTGEASGSMPSSTHPPLSARLATLEQIFVLMQEDEQAARDALPGMLVPSRTVDQLWRRVEPQLRRQYRAGSRLHRNWGG